MGSFFSGLLDSVSTGIDKHNEQEDALKKEKRDSFMKIAANPDSSDDVRNWAWGEYQKGLGPETKKKFGALQPIIDKITRAHQQQPVRAPGSAPTDGGPVPAPQAAPPNGDPGGPAPVASAPWSENGPNGKPIVIPPPGAVSTPPGPIFNRTARLKSEDDRKVDVANRIAAGKPKPIGTRSNPLQFKTEDGQDIFVTKDSKTGQFYDMQNEPISLPEGAKPVSTEKQTNMQKVWFQFPDDKEDAPAHMVWVDPRHPDKKIDAETNKPIPAGSKAVDEAAALAKIRASAYGNGLYNSWYAGLKAKGYPDDQAKEIAGDMVIQDHAKRLSLIGASKTTERFGMENGAPVAQTFVSRPQPAPGAPLPPPRNPLVPGATPPPAAAPGAPAPAAAAPVAPGGPAAAPAIPGAPPPGTPRPAAVPAVSSGARPIGSLPPGPARQYMQDFRALQTVENQIHGDPDSGLKGLADYSKLADSKDSQDKIGRALRLTTDGFASQSSEAGGHATAGGGGVSLGLGGLSTWVQNKMGVKPAIADQQTKMMQQAIGSLNPQELEAYYATIAASEAAVALRKPLGSSAARFAVDAIKQMVPMIGINSFSSAGFERQTKLLDSEVRKMANGIPDAALDPDSKKVMSTIKSRFSKAGGPAAAPKTATLSDIQEYAKAAKISEADARKAFAAKGYTIGK